MIKGNCVTCFSRREEISVLLRVSYLWYTLMGFLIAMIVGMAVSMVSGPQKPAELDPRLVWTFLRRFVGTKKVQQPILKTLPK